MKTLKRLSIAAVAAATLATAASAADKSNIHIGVGSADITGTGSTTVYNIGYGFTKGTTMLDNKLTWGIDFDLEFADVDGANVFGYGADFKVGYNVLPSVNTYVVAGAKFQDLDGIDAAGYNYGLGVDYAINDKFSVGAQYKQHEMTTDASDYDYDQVGVNVQYKF